ncbi:MAG: Lrp/AsnC family transcriptional regulator [Thermoproteota archaeon]|nr:Lrp/AsnC family transcriptional regulator [Thermoproteota archaeon]
MSDKTLTGRPFRLLQMLYEKGKPTTVYSVRMKQKELAQQLGISRQALNAHLRKLRDPCYIRTGRGFIDVTEKGLNMLGISVNPAFIFIKVSPFKRLEAYQKMDKLPVQRMFRVAGDMDAVLIVERHKLEGTLKQLSSVEGIQETRSYITIQALK